YQHACRENFILELSKYGMTKRDIVANLNFFMNVPIDPDGKFTVVDGMSAPGNYVDVTMDLDVIFVISNCPQVNNPCNGFNSTPIFCKRRTEATAVAPVDIASSTSTTRRPSIRGTRFGSSRNCLPASGLVIEVTGSDRASSYQNLREYPRGT